MTLELFDRPVYGLNRVEKAEFLLPRLQELTRAHHASCEPYRRILDARGGFPAQKDPRGGLEQFPFIPVRLFKSHELRSVASEEVLTVLTSSGTTSQAPSRIALDRLTAQRQTKALVVIMQSFLGKSRLPMALADHAGVVKDRRAHSARAAGILGFLNFGRDHTYLLDQTMQLERQALLDFARRHAGNRVFVFGFTFMVWEYLIRAVERSGLGPVFSGGILIHGGGWKKLQDSAVDNETFKSRARAVLGLDAVHNFYGMVEQVGSIFMECEHGALHAPAFADVIIRDPKDWSPLGDGSVGVVQVLSALPGSYPGHSLLTEDLGVLLGEDDCPCGRLGKRFRVVGRIPSAELRGCSDTHAATADERRV
ncbi:MAG: acyl-protein synthetase [Candidatus Wallbacteria bacterium]|nr:acyl-protein synthetase [Candidatus Wallbacteria bacterium]